MKWMSLVVGIIGSLGGLAFALWSAGMPVERDFVGRWEGSDMRRDVVAVVFADETVTLERAGSSTTVPVSYMPDMAKGGWETFFLEMEGEGNKGIARRDAEGVMTLGWQFQGEGMILTLQQVP